MIIGNLRYISGKIGLLEVQKLNRSKNRPVGVRFITLTGLFLYIVYYSISADMTGKPGTVFLMRCLLLMRLCSRFIL